MGSACGPSAAVRVSEVAQTTFEHVYEVDPRLMEQHVLQQVFPNWDTLRIMRSAASIVLTSWWWER